MNVKNCWPGVQLFETAGFFWTSRPSAQASLELAFDVLTNNS